MPRFITFALLLIHVALCGTAAAEPVEETFIFQIDGNSIGTERVILEERGDTLILNSFIHFDKPAIREMKTRTRVLGTEDLFLDYELITSRGDSILATAREDAIEFSIRAQESQQRDLVEVGDSRAMILDNAVSSHLLLLARQFMRDPDGEQKLMALVPQRVWSGGLERNGSRQVEARLDGKTIPVLRHRFTIVGLISELDTDLDGRLLALNVPLQGFMIRRPGYELAVAPVGGDGPEPRREPMTVNGGGPDLGGTLTLPTEGDGPFPACVFLHGSGPADRDMRMGPNRIFRQAADELAARGIASLRYDKRTLVMNRGTQRPNLYEDNDMNLDKEVLDDARAAVALLRTDPRVDPEAIFILGHSMGAGAAPTVSMQLAEAGMAPAGLVMLAPLGRDLLSIMVDQFRYLNASGFYPDEELERSEYNAGRLRDGRVGEDDMILYAKPHYWDSVLFWKPWRDYGKQPAPALILFGERDYQITEKDRERWEKTLAAGGPEGSEIHLLPGRNHLFLMGEGKPGPAEYGIPGELGEELMDLIGEWILVHGGS